VGDFASHMEKALGHCLFLLEKAKVTPLAESSLPL
jgi:hypothetical protein